MSGVRPFWLGQRKVEKLPGRTRDFCVVGKLPPLHSRQHSEKLRRRNPARYAFGYEVPLWKSLPCLPRRDSSEKRSIAPSQMPRRGLHARGLVELLRQIAALRREGAHGFEIGIAPVEIATAVTEFGRAKSGEIIGAAG